MTESNMRYLSSKLPLSKDISMCRVKYCMNIREKHSPYCCKHEKILSTYSTLLCLEKGCVNIQSSFTHKGYCQKHHREKMKSGFSYEKKKKRQKWSKEKVIQVAQEYRRKGGDLRSGSLRKDFPALWGQIYNYFDSYPEFASLLGIEKKEKEKKIVKKWSKEKVIEEVQNYLKKGGSLEISAIKKYSPSLLNQIYHYFDSYYDFAYHLGVDYEKYKMMKRIEKMNEKTQEKREEMIKITKEYVKKGGNLKTSSLQKHNPSFLNQIYQYFDSHSDFISHLEIDYEKKNPWTKERVIQEFQTYMKGKDHVPTSRELRKEKPSLLYKIYDFYDRKYTHFLDEMGYKPSKKTTPPLP